MDNKLFDLDLKVNRDVNKMEPRINSKVLCTPGSCNCGNGDTFASACCSVEITFYHCTGK